MHNRLYRLSHGIMTVLACLFTVLVFLLNVLYQSEVSYTEYEVTTISGQSEIQPACARRLGRPDRRGPLLCAAGFRCAASRKKSCFAC